MITVNIRKQGGAAIITIPADILKILNLEIGTTLELDIEKEGFFAKPITHTTRKRYTLQELLHGVTPKYMTTLNAETAWAREGKPKGREVI
ncbi:MAG TPA: AbrB/MazE/SpoVT family DNA-binding domain-containing protein [Gammaproteobacteria bacterium]|nr:AbrB/MazE/SpoVT family DNA-binding domain-containing protein [Gammaproteobacteria bacterium]